MPRACRECFEEYCWDGTVDDTPVKSFEPDLLFGTDSDSDSAGVSVGVGAAWMLTAVGAWAALVL